MSTRMKGNSNALGYKHKPEVGDKIRKRKLGKKLPKKTCQNISKATTENWKDPEYRAYMIMQQNKGRQRPEYRIKRKALAKALWQNPKFRTKVTKAIRKAKGLPPNRQIEPQQIAVEQKLFD